MKDFFWHAERPFALLQTDAIGDLQIARGKLRTDKPSRPRGRRIGSSMSPRGHPWGGRGAYQFRCTAGESLAPQLHEYVYVLGVLQVPSGLIARTV